jgi:hypothetical protein
VGGAFVILIGLGVLATALVFNPLTGRMWQGVYAIDKADVMRSYCLWAIALGGLIIRLGTAFSRTQTAGRIDRVLLLVLPLSMLILGDRFLLVEFGLPLWSHDTELHYRHRPNTVRTLARVGRPEDLISINRHGHHDTDYPVAKPEGEFRGLMIGDSVTMGDQVPYRDTFSAQLEAMLADRAPDHPGFQIINTGVHGYATLQEAIVLEREMRFEPDFIAIGFCMNDLTEPSVVKRGFDGAAVDYHRVAPTSNPIQGYLMNESGLGRLAQTLPARGHTKAGERHHQLMSVREFATSRGDPEVEKAYAYVLQDLEGMYKIARDEQVPIVLVIFPFTFQLLQVDAREPQRRLAAHATALGVPVLDFTDTFANLVYDDPELLALLDRKGYTTDQIERMFVWRMREYFLDDDHLTTRGHTVVSSGLLEHLVAAQWIR